MTKMKISKSFKRKYDRIFKVDPVAANMLLLLKEMANSKGQIELYGSDDECMSKLTYLMNKRFPGPVKYEL